MTRRDVAAAAAVAAIAAAYLSIYATRRLPMVDEGIVWVFADEIIRGRLPYRDYECVYTPLAFYIHAAYARLAGPGIWAGRLWICAVASIGAAAAYLAARTFAGRAAAAAAAFAVVASSYAYHVYASYNVYAVTITLAGAAAALRAFRSGSPAAWAVAGLLAGLAFWTKQNIGGLFGIGAGAAALGAAVSRRRPGIFGAYAAGALGCLAAGVASLASAGLLAGFWRDAVVWSFTRIPRLGGRYPFDQAERLADLLRSPSLRTLDAFAHSASFVALVAVPALLGIVAVRTPPQRRGAAPALAAIAALQGFAVWHEPTTWHIALARPLLVLAGAALLVALAARGRVAGAAAALVAAGFVALHAGRTYLVFDDHTAAISAPRAEGIRLRPWEAEAVDAVLSLLGRVPRGETVWIAAADILYYHLDDRPLPVRRTYIEPEIYEALGWDRPLREELEAAGIRHIIALSGRGDAFDVLRIGTVRAWVDRDFEEVARVPRGGIGEAILYRRRDASATIPP